MIETYDQANPKDIERFAKLLVGRSLRDLVEPYEIGLMTPGKGKLGTATEKYYFHINPGNSPLPDFPEAGVELKTGRIYMTKNGWSAKDRMVMSKIDFTTIHKETFETSSFMKKNKLLMLMFYVLEGKRHGLEYLDAIFKLAELFEFPEADKEIIKQDWEKIAEKVGAGLAHELSEGDTLYLAACPKGINKEDTTAQPFSEEDAMKRAYSLKQGYVTSIVRRMIDAEPIVKANELSGGTVKFEDLVLAKFEPYIGLTPEEIAAKIGVKVNFDAKGGLASLTRLVLGVKTKKVAEFEKANIKEHTIRLTAKGTPKESISFPYFKYKEIVQESWGESTFREKLEERWFVVIYQYDPAGKLTLRRVKFWNMPYRDVMEAQKVWLETRKRINSNQAEVLPKSSENSVCHTRPHGSSKKDVCETPQGDFLPKKSFWLNSKYIKSSIVK